jgi:hypothetical protein
VLFPVTLNVDAPLFLSVPRNTLKLVTLSTHTSQSMVSYVRWIVNLNASVLNPPDVNLLNTIPRMDSSVQGSSFTKFIKVGNVLFDASQNVTVHHSPNVQWSTKSYVSPLMNTRFLTV